MKAINNGQRGGGWSPPPTFLPPSQGASELPSPLREADTPEPLLRVRIDLPKLRENLSQTWRRRLSSQEVRDFLARSGFRPAGEGGDWLAGDSLLMRLDPSEVLSAEPLARRLPGRN